MLKDNVALIAVLEALDVPNNDAGSSTSSGDKARRQLVCIANTHIHANPELSDVKLWQVSFQNEIIVLLSHPLLIASQIWSQPHARIAFTDCLGRLLSEDPKFSILYTGSNNPTATSSCSILVVYDDCHETPGELSDNIVNVGRQVNTPVSVCDDTNYDCWNCPLQSWQDFWVARLLYTGSHFDQGARKDCS